jgi:hypothetical protein
MRHTSGIGLLLAVLLISACGGDGNGGDELSAADESTVADAEAHFVGIRLFGYEETERAVNDLIALCREHPDATYRRTENSPERTLRQVVEDGAAELRSSAPDLAAELEQVADNNCE